MDLPFSSTPSIRQQGVLVWAKLASAALRVAAGVADDAAFLLGEAAGAIGAGPDDGEFPGFCGAVLDEVVFAHGPGDAVGDGEDGVGADAGGVAVLDAA